MYILVIITEIFKAGTFRCRKRHPTPAPASSSRDLIPACVIRRKAATDSEAIPACSKADWIASIA